MRAKYGPRWVETGQCGSHMIGIVLRGGLPVRVAFDASTAHNCIESEVHFPSPLEPSSAIINAEMALTVTLHFRSRSSDVARILATRPHMPFL
jgi:hypothetical protein